MDEPESDNTPEDEADVRERMDGLAAKLVAQGLHSTVQVVRRECYIAATLHRPGHKNIDLVIDADGYTELRYWADLAASPEQTVSVILRALAAITGTELSQSERPPPT